MVAHFSQVLLGFGAAPPISTPTLVGSYTVQNSSSVTSYSFATTQDIKAGDLVVIGAAGNFGANVTITGISDGVNNYTKASSSNNGVTYSDIWYKENAAAVPSGSTITVSLSGSTSSNTTVAASVARVTGIVASSSLDKTASANSTSGTSLSSTTATLSQANEIAFGHFQAVQGTAYSGASGFTNLYSNGAAPITAFDYQIVNSTAALTFNPQWSTSSVRNAQNIATFKGF